MKTHFPPRHPFETAPALPRLRPGSGAPTPEFGGVRRGAAGVGDPTVEGRDGEGGCRQRGAGGGWDLKVHIILEDV